MGTLRFCVCEDDAATLGDPFSNIQCHYIEVGKLSLTVWLMIISSYYFSVCAKSHRLI